MPSNPAPIPPAAGTAHRRQALHLAGLINTLLLRELDQGVDPGRLLVDRLYARDVLLVCDAYVGSDLAALARQFRAVMASPAVAQRQPSAPAGAAMATPAQRAQTQAKSQAQAQAKAKAWQQQAAAARGDDGERDSERDNGRDNSGFGVSRFLNSLFGPLVGSDSPARAHRPWFGRDRGSR